MYEWTKQGQGRLATAKARHNEGIDALAVNDTRKAAVQFADALKIRECILPPHHPLCVATLDILTNVTLRNGEKQKGKEMLLKLYDRQRDRFGAFHQETEATLQRLVGLYRELGDHTSADKYAEEIWKIRTASRSERFETDFERLLGELPVPEHIRARLPQSIAAASSEYTSRADAARLIRESIDERVARSAISKHEHDAQQASRNFLAGASRPSNLDPELAKLLEKSTPTKADYLLANGSPPPPTPPDSPAPSPSPPPPPLDDEDDLAPDPPALLPPMFETPPLNQANPAVVAEPPLNPSSDETL